MTAASEPLQPLPETLSVLQMLSTVPQAHPDLVGVIQGLADRVVATVPDCVGLSLTYREHDLTFTYVRTTQLVAALDGVQYADEGPCEVSSRTGDEIVIGDLLDEHRWQLYAQSSAAAGVRSSLSLPIRHGDRVIGSVNCYGATPDAFAGQELDLARLFGAWVQEAVRNADLSMSTLKEARQAPAVLAEREVIDQAVGALASRRGISPEAARQRVADAAVRSGSSEAEIARAIVLGQQI